jgi:hypothetical protein
MEMMMSDQNKAFSPAAIQRPTLEAPMFVRTAAFVKTVNEWKARNSRRSADAAARAYARENMVAVVMRGDDGAIVYLYDVANDRIARVTYDAPEWAA